MSLLCANAQGELDFRLGPLWVWPAGPMEVEKCVWCGSLPQIVGGATHTVMCDNPQCHNFEVGLISWDCLRGVLLWNQLQRRLKR